MSNSVYIHLRDELNPTLKVDKNFGQDNDVNFRFGNDANMFTTLEQAEKLFKEMDKQLHEPTDTKDYLNQLISELEDKVFTLEDDAEQDAERIEQLEDNLENGN